MSTLHELSNILPHPDFDLFSVPSTQLTIERDIQSEHRPISILTSSSAVEFVIHLPIDEYAQLRDTLFKIKLKVNIKNKDNSKVTAATWAKIAPVNYLLQSLFSYIQVEINGKNTTFSQHTYPYKTYFDALVGFTDDAKKVS